MIAVLSDKIERNFFFKEHTLPAHCTLKVQRLKTGEIVV